MTLPRQRPRLFLVIAAGAWLGAYGLLLPVSQAIVALLPVDPDTHFGAATQFFLYDTPKVLLLLTLVVFVVGVVRSYFTADRARRRVAASRDHSPRCGAPNSASSGSDAPPSVQGNVEVFGSRAQRQADRAPWQRNGSLHLA